MRLALFSHPTNRRSTDRGYMPVCAATLAVLCACSAPASQAQGLPSPVPAQARIHESEQWAEIARHLPDPATATPAVLEQQGDILRARRYPEDALDYYKYAQARGGERASLSNKMGLAELEMKNVQLAQVFFERVVKLDKKSAEGWNNLGAAEFLDGSIGSATRAYKNAIKLDKGHAIYHSNLANIYFQGKDYKAAQRELTIALKLDPRIFDRREGLGGVEAHVLSAEDRARFSFEMAKLYARNGLEVEMLHSLAMASEAGMDVQREMHHDAYLTKFEEDPRVLVLVRNAQLLRTGHGAALSAYPQGSAADGS
jgi:tetratricopeptide (TPR) repeat protein